MHDYARAVKNKHLHMNANNKNTTNTGTESSFVVFESDVWSMDLEKLTKTFKRTTLDCEPFE